MLETLQKNIFINTRFLNPVWYMTAPDRGNVRICLGYGHNRYRPIIFVVAIVVKAAKIATVFRYRWLCFVVRWSGVYDSL